MDPGAEPSELAVETLLADLALTRLGALLQGAREQHSSSRRDVASKVGTTARELRRYETGAVPVPHGIATALAEFYGEDLNTEFAPRSSTRIESARTAEGVDETQVQSAHADEVLRAYLGILRRDPQVKLSAVDIATLSTALAVEPEEVEGRIAELLTFTTGLRRNSRVRRRRRILSGAGLAILLATGTGFGIGALVGASPSPADPVSSTVPGSSTATAASSTTATTAASSTTVVVSSTVATLPVTDVQPPPAIAPPPITAPPTTALAIGTAVTLVETTTTTAATTTTTTTTTFPRPHITTDTTPISIPGTEPVTIITNP